jgi:hypothetical protein
MSVLGNCYFVILFFMCYISWYLLLAEIGYVFILFVFLCSVV